MSRLDMEADFSAFVATWQHVLQRSAYLLCGDRQRAEDVVQIVLVRMYARWGRIQAAPGRVVITDFGAAIEQRR